MKKILIALALLSVAGCGESNYAVTSQGKMAKVYDSISGVCIDGVVYFQINTYGYTAKFDKDSKVVTCGQPMMGQPQ